MRDHAVVGGSLPGRNIRRELEPSGSQREVVRDGRSGELIHPVRDPLKGAIGGESLQGRSRDARVLDLAAREETPLLGGDVDNPT